MKGQPLQRPDAYAQTAVPKAQQQLSLMAPVGAGLNAIAKGRGGGAVMAAAFDSPLGAAAAFGNPLGRARQIGADMRYLRNSKAADAVAGMPKISRISPKLVDALIPLGLIGSGAIGAAAARGTDGEPPTAMRRLATGVLAGSLASGATITGIKAVRDLRRGRKFGPLDLLYSTLLDTTVAAVPAAVGSAATTAGIVGGSAIGKALKNRREKNSSAPILSPKRIGLLAAAIPTLAAGAWGTEKIVDTLNNMQEEKRFRRLTTGDENQLRLNPALFGDGASMRMDTNALDNPSAASEATSRNLREYRRAFRDLNKVAPSVAKNPRLAASFLPSMVQGPMAIGSGTEEDKYRRALTDAVRLENELQKSQNTLFDGISSANKVGLSRITG